MNGAKPVSDNLLLILGYLLAVPPLFVLVRAFKKWTTSWPGVLVLAAEGLGALFVTLGWLGKNQIAPVIINGSWLVIFSGLWLRFALKKKSPVK